jgi:hypothetical protein
VSDVTVYDDTAAPPNVTDVAPVKLVPVIVTRVPPLIEPFAGDIPLTVGTYAWYVYWSAAVRGDVPPAVVTVTFTWPSEWAGATAVIDVADTTVSDVAATPPNETDVALARFVPVIVTVIPPATVPLEGLIPVTVGAGTAKVNLSAAETAEVPSGLVTAMSTIPAACEGAMAVIVADAALNVNEVAATVPNETAVTSARPVPVIVTLVPPAIGPEAGLTEVIAGGMTWNVNRSAVLVADVPLAVVTVMSQAPPACTGAIAVIDVMELTVNDAAATPPKATPVAPVKFVPVIVTLVPPFDVPLAGLTLVTVGART